MGMSYSSITVAALVSKINKQRMIKTTILKKPPTKILINLFLLPLDSLAFIGKTL